MASLMIKDFRDPTSASNPKIQLKNPLCLFTENAWHGGCWRTAYKFQSIGAPAFLSYLVFAFGVTPYLMFYSMYQAAGWAAAMPHLFSFENSAGLWAAVGPRITYFQWLGALEVVHAAIGFTSSSAGMTLLQQFSRWAVCGLLNVTAQSTMKEDNFWLRMMLTAWCIAEVNRYVYYAVGQARTIGGSVKSVGIAMKMFKAPSMDKADDPIFKIPFPLVWLRYSLFIPLYPLGVSGELAIIWKTIGAAMAPGALGNADNLSTWLLRTMKIGSFGMGTGGMLTAIFLAYAAGLPALYSMMLAGRKKQLGGGSKKASGGKKSQ